MPEIVASSGTGISHLKAISELMRVLVMEANVAQERWDKLIAATEEISK
jgi:hypothetical protein